MEHPADELILKQPEQVQSVIWFLREFIPSQNSLIDERYKYRTIFFYYRDRPFCYVNPEKNGLYIGFVMGHQMKKRKSLIAGGRSMIRSWHIDPEKDLNIKELKDLLKEGMKILDDELSKRFKTHGRSTAGKK
jgi:hypothetical protein